nr:unnamed protein product [Callosobruchus analis]
MIIVRLFASLERKMCPTTRSLYPQRGIFMR